MATITETYDRDLMIVKCASLGADDTASTSASYRGFVVQALVTAASVTSAGTMTIKDDNEFDVLNGLTMPTSSNSSQFTQNGSLDGGIAVDGVLDFARASGNAGTYTITLYIARYQ